MTTSPIEPFELPALEPDGALVISGGDTPLARAAEIVRQAQSEASKLAEAAEAEGRERGYAAGVEQARAEVESARAVLEQAVEGVLAEREAFLEQAELRAVELALLIAEKVLGAALEVDPTRVVGVIAATMRGVTERDRLTVEVNPADYDLVHGAVGELGARFGGHAGIELVAERRVGRGGCIVRTSEGEIDAQIEEQLARAGDLLRDVLASGATDG
jgi:flagellar assembly protein FliH